MVSYIFLIYGEESSWENATPEERTAVLNGYGQVYQDAMEKGVLVGADELQSVQTATTVSVRNGKTLITDGPFAETKEQLGGYFILNCENLDEAIEWAARFPTALDGRIEIRPLEVREPADG